ncbi:MAG: hypothetical protein M1833_000903 [Piccolia ochrophora]|nr:MAG: hypothetical protein M1833_000903 [Piccolia ochrophora]
MPLLTNLRPALSLSHCRPANAQSISPLRTSVRPSTASHRHLHTTLPRAVLKETERGDDTPPEKIKEQVEKHHAKVKEGKQHWHSELATSSESMRWMMAGSVMGEECCEEWVRRADPGMRVEIMHTGVGLTADVRARQVKADRNEHANEQGKVEEIKSMQSLTKEWAEGKQQRVEPGADDSKVNERS